MALPRTPSFGLDGKRALVTGSTSGIGMAAAVALAMAGAHVTLAARSKDKLKDLVDEFHSNGWRASCHAIDVSDVRSVGDWINSELPFDILINSAGLARHSSALDAKPEDFDAVMAVNLGGTFSDASCRAAAHFGGKIRLPGEHFVPDGPRRWTGQGDLLCFQICRGGFYQGNGNRVGQIRMGSIPSVRHSSRRR